MKRFLFLLFFILSSSLHALFISNPSSTQIFEKGLFLSDESAFGLKVGYEGDFVFDRRVKASKGFHGKIDEFRIMTNQGVITGNAFDRFDLYGILGAAKVHVHQKPRNYDFNSSFTWGGGARLFLFEWSHVCFGVEARYQQAWPTLERVSVNGRKVPSHDSWMMYQEWQASAALSYEFEYFIPYVGADYSHVRAQMRRLSKAVGIGSSHFLMKNQEHWGMAVGGTFSNHEIVAGTIEFKFFDEYAMTIAADVKF